MKNNFRVVLASGLLVIFLSSACGAMAEGALTPVETILTDNPVQPVTPLPMSTAQPTATGLVITPLIPITGKNVVSLQCQFCVDGETHAVLVFPDIAYFDVVAFTPVTCFTADVVNGSRILVCRGAQQTSFNLNICSDSTNCLQFPVALQECPLVQPGTPLVTSTPFTPFFLNPINTLEVREDDPSQPSNTPVPSLTPPPDATTAPPPTSVTSEPPTNEPTDPPPPTDEPTAEPTEPDDRPGRPTRKPSNTPRPTNENRAE